MLDNTQAKEDLALIKTTVLAIPARYAFSSYLEYFCNMKIEDFSFKEIERAADNLIPMLEKVVARGSPAQALKRPLSYGAGVFGCCYILPEFVEDLRSLPKEVYWAIWFCMEVLEHLAWNNVKSVDSLVTVSDFGLMRFRVPTGHVLTYQSAPITTHHGERVYVVELMEAQEEFAKHEQQSKPF